HAPYATPAQLEQLLREHRGRGARKLREVLRDVRVGADSPAETTLRLAILRAGLPVPHLNVFLRAGGASLGQADLSWPEWKVCVEHEGPSHLDRDQQDQDIQRGERRRHHGWIEVQTTAKDLRGGCARGLRRITEALRRQGWRGRARSARALRPSHVHAGLGPEAGSPARRRARARPGSVRGTARHATSAKWWDRKPIATRSQSSVGRTGPAGASSAKRWVREPIATTSQSSVGRGSGPGPRGRFLE